MQKINYLENKLPNLSKYNICAINKHNLQLTFQLKLDKSFCTQKQSVPTACKVYVKF